MDDELKRRQNNARSLLVATADIRAATDACRLFLKYVKSKDDPLYIPLLNAIIVCYSRPFRKNIGYSPLEERWHKFENKELQGVHEALLDMRDKAVAHSDSDIRKVKYELDSTPLGRRISEVRVVSQTLPMEIFPNMLETCLDLGNRLELEALNELDCLSEGETN